MFPNHKLVWKVHYTKHQKLTAFGECGLFAAVYRSLLLKGLNPSIISEAEILRKVSVLKELICGQHPDYFIKYNHLFQFAFSTNFAQSLLEEIERLPKNWGIEPEASDEVQESEDVRS